MHLETLAVHAGRPTEASNAVTPDIVLSTTFERNTNGEVPSGYKYGRYDNPNRRALETRLAALEGGAAAVAFSAGVAAAAGVLSTLQPGQRVLAALDIFYGTRHLMTGEFGRWGLGVDFADFTDLDAVRRAMRPETALLFVETPSNPLIQITDIAGLAQIAHAGGARLAVDNTFATPILQNPLALDADYAVHSSSKFFGGHTDIVGGCVIAARDDADTTRIREHQTTAGAVPSPFDCWLLSRSLATLPLRVRAQTATAQCIAEFLAAHRAIRKVNYPGLPDDPGHALAARQMHDGFGAMLSFHVAGGRAPALAFVSRLQLFTRATSLGGVESLIEHRASSEGPDSKTPQDLIRASIGIEHADDLIADLEQALT
ncbi:MAG TPA: PLP-dependent transferase [Nevskiaceae bacterium]|nr:PLP-dependent transferase [Nevskiaceae bacterium]